MVGSHHALVLNPTNLTHNDKVHGGGSSPFCLKCFSDASAKVQRVGPQGFNVAFTEDSSIGAVFIFGTESENVLQKVHLSHLQILSTFPHIKSSLCCSEHSSPTLPKLLSFISESRVTGD